MYRTVYTKLWFVGMEAVFSSIKSRNLGTGLPCDLGQVIRSGPRFGH
jgi:hypothetical protein